MRKYCLTFALLGAFALLGCSGKPAAYPVTGMVTFDGQPIPEGDVIFLDAENKVGPDAGKIKDGKFAFKVKAGKKKVEIRASRLEKLPSGKTGAMGETEMPTDYIPERYGKQTQLTADVASGGPNQYDFKLTSK